MEPARPSVPRVLVLVAILAAVMLASGCGSDPGAEGEGGVKPRVFIVHSYDNGFRWTAEQHKGIVEGLARGGYTEDDIELRVFYMDTRVNFVTEEQIALRVAIAFKTIEEFKPDLVFLTDDAAVEKVGLAYLREHPESKVPFVFSGVNGDPSLYAPVRSLSAPGGNITGTVERIPFTEGFDAAIRVFGSIPRVVVFADDSPSSRTVIESFRRSLTNGGASYPLQVVDFIQVTTFEEWKQKVGEYRNRVDAIAVLNYHRVRDTSGNIVLPRDVARWTVENSEVPVFGLISDWSADGFVMSFGNSGFDTGVFVGQRGSEVLRGVAAGTMPIVDPYLYEMTFNLTTIEKLDLTIPRAELERASETFK